MEQGRDGDAGLVIRAATPDDAGVLVEFNRAMARETEDKELDPVQLRAGVDAVFADASRGRYVLALSGGEPVGALLLTYEWSDWRNGVFWWIQSVYVTPGARGKGVFGALYRHVESEAREAADVCGLRLYVDLENERAQRVYEALGMAPSHYRFYEVDFVLGGK